MASAGDRWTQKPQYRVGLLVLERKRDGFDVAWGKKTRGKCWEALVTICGNNGYALKPLNGDHERVADDRSLRRALQKAHGDVDVVVKRARADDEDDRDGARVDCNHARTRPRRDFYLDV